MAEIKRLSTELQVKDKLLDTSGDAGTSGQILSSTGTGTNWINAGTFTGGTVANATTFSSTTTFSSMPILNADILVNGHVYGRYVNNESSRLYRFGGLYLTWDSDSYGTNDHHSLRSTYGNSFTDSITLNSFNHIRFNIDSNNNNSTSYFEVGDGVTDASTPIFRLDQAGDVTITGDITVSGGDIILGGDVNLYRDGDNILRTDDAFHANGHIHVGGASGGGNIYNRSDTGNYIGFSSNAITFSKNATFLGTVTADNIVKATNSGSENAMLQASATGTGYAGMYLDASNGDFSGSDYFSIVQKNDLSVEFDVRANAGNTIFKSKGATNLTMNGANSTFAGQITVSGGTKLGGGSLQVTTDSTYISNYTYTFRDAVGINNPNSTSAASSTTTVMAIGARSGGTVNTSLITTGAVAIGHAAPTSTLHVNGTSNITGNATFGGNVTVSGDLNITGDINSTSVTDLDVTDKTITIAKGAADSAAADGAGIVVDGASASILYDHTGTQWEINKPLEVTGTLSNPQFESGSIAVTLKNNGNTRLLTTGGGVDITGGLSVGNINSTGTLSITSTYPRINLTDTNHDDDWSIINADGNFRVYNITDAVDSFNIDASNNATFAGSVTLTPSSGHSYFGSGSGKDLNINAGSGLVYFNNTGATTFAGKIHVGSGTPNGVIDIHAGNGNWRVNDYGAMYFRNSSNATHESYIHSRSDGSLSIGRVAESDWSGSGVGTYAATTYDHVKFDTSSNAIFAGELTIPGYINHAGDSGTAIGFDANDVIRLKTASSTAVQIDSSQNVKVVAGKLQISGDNDHFVELVQSGNGLMTIAAPDDIVLDAESDITLDANGADIRLKRGGTHYATLRHNNTGLDIQANESNASIYLSPNGTGNVYASTDTFIITATEGETAKLLLRTDEGDDNGDDWYITNESLNDLTFKNDRTGSQLANLTLTPQSPSSSAIATFAGDVVVGNRIQTAVGSTGAPAYTFTGKTDTGMWVDDHSSNDRLRFSVDGTNRLYLDSNGAAVIGNLYLNSGNSVRNYSGVWSATTGTSGNGFTFANTADNSGAVLLSITSDSSAASASVATFAGQVNVAETLKIGGATSGTKTLIFESTTNAQDYNIDFYSNAGSVQGRINYAEGAGSINLSPNSSATAALSLAYDGSATFAGAVGIGSNQLTINNNASNNDNGIHIKNDTNAYSGAVTFWTEYGGTDTNVARVLGGTNGSNGILYLQVANTSKALTTALSLDYNLNASFAASVHLNSDSAQLQLGDDNDMQVYHNGANGFINNGVGDFTIQSVDEIKLDAAGDITLDAGGADIILRDDGTEFGRLKNDSSDFVIRSTTNNKDLKLQGVDNGLTITALRLDMSDAGWAHFNTGIAVGNSSATSTFAGNVTISGDLNITGDIADRDIPCIINTGWGDDSSTTSNLMVPLGNTVDDVSTGAKDGEHTFVAPYAGKLVKIIMKNTNGTLSSSFTTELKYYKNGSSTATSGELTASSSAITWAPTSNNTFAAGDEINILYQKSAGSKYWREVSMTIVIELTDYDI